MALKNALTTLHDRPTAGECELWLGRTPVAPESRTMKWLSILAVTAGVVLVLWKLGFVEKFLGPWASWAKWIGYFQ